MAKKAQLGIYFSYDFLGIVEQQDSKVLNFVKAPCVLQETKSGLSQTVADEVKVVSLVKDLLLNNNITSRDAILALSSKDLIVRFFEIPLVPRGEIDSAVGFEAKRYIPFKLEEVIYDFHAKPDRKAKKIAVLFIAVKKEIIDKYISILEQADLSIVAIEPAFVSTLRVLRFTKSVVSKAPILVVDINFALGRGDIAVVEDFYPRFSRDINLTIQGESISRDAIVSKLINEIRISLDYCRRQFKSDTLQINKLVLLGSDEVTACAETLNKELEISVVPVNIQSKIAVVGKDFDSELIKAYGASLKDQIDFPLRIDLFGRLKAAVAPGGGLELEGILEKIGQQIDKELLIKSFLILFGIVFLAYLLGMREVTIARNKLARLKKERKKIVMLEHVKTINKASLKNIEKEYKKKISTAKNIRKNRRYISPKLSAIASLRRDGMWLSSVAFVKSDDAQTLVLKGFVYLGDEQKEFSTLNQFLSSLKEEEAFSGFVDISLASISLETVNDYPVTKFDIMCR